MLRSNRVGSNLTRWHPQHGHWQLHGASNFAGKERFFDLSAEIASAFDEVVDTMAMYNARLHLRKQEMFAESAEAYKGLRKTLVYQVPNVFLLQMQQFAQ